MWLLALRAEELAFLHPCRPDHPCCCCVLVQFDEPAAGGWGRPAAPAPEPTRRSSRRAAAAGVARLTAALHGPSEYDEDE